MDEPSMPLSWLSAIQENVFYYTTDEIVWKPYRHLAGLIDLKKPETNNIEYGILIVNNTAIVW